ncbi:predicted protein [Histoplasma mississippiense (nom. inval.)]|uniref:predicted protein n=1 Tax=Ajellomyces capsulatus (strain NAm1 / WU24) TaxID=2059318 RepID=UPI000157B8DD|nr:predicted protein [Histoplasma mississippiense (nom. inval.)]EDN03307.1 predicted protein [Histoplasma mississippiense (nom. inval.)]
MATKKDMRRPELVVPYVEPPAKASEASDMSSTMSNTMPMAADDCLVCLFQLVTLKAWESHRAD